MRSQSYIAVPLFVATMLLLATTSCAPKPKPKGELDEKEVTTLRLEMAERLVAQRDYDRALPYLRALRARHPKSLRLQLLFGVVLREKKMYSVAKKELEGVLKSAPKSAEAQSAYAVLMDKMNKHGVAEKHHQKAVELAPSDARYHNDLGFCYFLQRRFDEAQNALEQAIRLDPSMRRAYNNLGFVFALQDRERDALTAFRQAGNRALALTNMGLVAELKGQPVKARRYYEKALRIDATYEPALRNMRALDPQFGEGDKGDEDTSRIEARRATASEQILQKQQAEETEKPDLKKKERSNNRSRERR